MATPEQADGATGWGRLVLGVVVGLVTSFLLAVGFEYRIQACGTKG